MMMNSTVLAADRFIDIDDSPPCAAPNLFARADVLSAFLAPCRIQCRQMRPWQLTAPWGLEFSNAGPGFLIVLEGGCLLRTAGTPDELTLRPNDFMFFTRRGRFVLCDRPGSRLMNVDQFLETADPAPREELSLGGGGPTTRLLWGQLCGDDDYTRQAFSLLPAYLLAHGEGLDAAPGVGPLLTLLLEEIDDRRAGNEVLVSRLLFALLIYALRATGLTLPNSKGFLAALGVPGLGISLAAMHSRPDYDWNVEKLAEAAGLSRSKFALRFEAVLGRTPADYLRDVRMRLASQLLRETDAGIKEITARVGYSTEASFSRTFSHWCGCAPGKYRRQKRADHPSGG